MSDGMGTCGSRIQQHCRGVMPFRRAQRNFRRAWYAPGRPARAVYPRYRSGPGCEGLAVASAEITTFRSLSRPIAVLSLS